MAYVIEAIGESGKASSMTKMSVARDAFEMDENSAFQTKSRKLTSYVYERIGCSTSPRNVYKT